MTTLNYSILINAPREKVWEDLWADSSYREWTAAFFDGSFAESDWKEGSEVLFLSPARDGMYSIITKNIYAREMVFEHKGEMKKGTKIPRDWGDASESYYLNDEANGTRVDVRLNILDEGIDYFNKTFPKALLVLKDICERS